MKTEGDYLWDRTGEPDPEVQQLEEILGTLRYQPRPLRIPAGTQNGHERRFFRGSTPRLAIAAAIVALLLGVGLFLGLQRLQRDQAPAVVKSGDPINLKTNSSPEDKRDSAVATATPHADEKLTVAPRRHRLNQSLAVAKAIRIRNAAIRSQQLAEERKRAEAAKDQLMLALRVATAKFSFAQKKAQSLNQKDQVHNQHKIG
jgi:hypothetical protein